MRFRHTGNNARPPEEAVDKLAGPFPAFAAALFCLLLVGCASAWNWNAGSGDYVVHRGDTLYSIAFQHQLDYHTLARWNDIPPPYTIYPGEKISLLPSGHSARPPVSSGRHRVASASRSHAASHPEHSKQHASSSSSGARKSTASHKELKGRGQGNGWRWPAAGKVTRGFKPSSNSNGINIVGKVGESIRATAPGKVVYSGHGLKGYGKLIIVKHAGPYLSAYGHNRSLGVKEGAQVHAGEVIAKMGLGPERKPMLHFEIRKHGKPVDPLSLLPPH